MKNLKSLKRTNESHVSKTGHGSGDYYGSGVRNPIGRVRESYMDASPMTNKSLMKPPKSLA